MAKDFMSTQTGGEGPTIQATNPNMETPEMYDVNINPPTGTEPPPSPVIQQTMLDAQPVSEVTIPDPVITQNVPSSPEVGFMDWFSGDVVKSVLDETIDAQAPKEPEQVILPPTDGIDLDFLQAPTQSDSEQQNPLADLPLFGSDPIPQIPTKPLGVNTEDWQALRDKYKGYEIDADAFGNVTIKKPKSDQSTVVPGKPQPKQKPVTPVDYTGKILEYPDRPGYEYQIVDNTWQRRKKGGEWNTLTNDGSINALNNHFGVKVPTLEKYSYPGREENEYAIINNQWNVRKKDSGPWEVINNPGRIDALNKYHKKDIQPQATKLESLDRAAKIQKASGLMLDATPMSFISKDSNGDPITSSSVTAQSLFGAGKMGSTFAQNTPSSFYQEKRSGLERERDNELSFAKTEQQKNEVINRYSKLIGELDNNQKLESEFVQKNNQEFFKAKPETDLEKKKKEAQSQVIESFKIKGLGEGFEINDANFNVFDRISNGMWSNVDELKVAETKDRAQSFINNDLDNWRKAYGNHLTDDQFKELKVYQEKLKNVDLDDLSPKGIDDLRKGLSEIVDTHNEALKLNIELNQIAASGKSLSEHLLDKKKVMASTIASDLGVDSFMGRTKELFNATIEMHGFLMPYVKSGKVVEDKNGVYKVAPGVSKTEAAYIDSKLKGFLNEYDKVKNTTYNTIQDDIVQRRKERSVLQLSIDQAKIKLDQLTPGSDEYKFYAKKIASAEGKLKSIDNDISDLQNNNRAFFLTEPKELAKSISGDINGSSLRPIFSAIDKDLSPKAKFDLFYSALFEENQRLAREHGIDTSRFDRGTARLKSMTVGLNEIEKKYYHNKNILYSLAPLYLNNENGITEESAGFFDSFMNGFTKFLYGQEVMGGAGFQNQTQVVNEQLNQLYSLGFSKDDLANEINMNDLEDRQNVSWVSAEGIGDVLAPTAAIMVQMMAGNAIFDGMFKAGQGALNLIKYADRTGDVIGAGTQMAKSAELFKDALLTESRVGRYLIEPIDEAIKFQKAGMVMGSAEEELNAASGFLGSLASKGLISAVSAVPLPGLIPMISAIFGSQTNRALAVFSKIGQTTARGAGEVSEEFAQELTNVYREALDGRDFWEGVEARWGTMDDVMKFVATSFIMGGAFGFAQSSTAKDIYENMPEADRAIVSNVVSEARDVVTEAASKVDQEATEMLNQVEAEQKVEQIFEGTDDKEIKAGASGEERIREELIETKPNEATSIEEASSSGVVQETEQVVEDVKPVKQRKGVPSATGKTDKTVEKLESLKVPESTEGVVTEELQKPEVKTEADPIDDFGKISRMRSVVKKKQAIDQYEAVHGKGSYKRVSGINDKFADIVSALETKGVIEKKC